MLTFEGERDFSLPPDQVWPRLRDAAFLAECIPNASIVGTPTQDQARCSVKPGLSFLGGSLDGTIDILEALQPTSVKIQLGSKGVGASSEVVVNLEIEPKGHGAWVRYRAEVTHLGGLLKAIPSGLIRGAAHKVIEQVWEHVDKRMREPGA